MLDYDILYCATVSFHDFKSQNFKLSVSNPKNKYVAYLSVLSHNSNCQGVGRKNKHEFLKTDRTSGVCVCSWGDNSLHANLRLAVLQQKLLSRPRFGALKASLPKSPSSLEERLFRRTRTHTHTHTLNNNI